MYGSEFKTSDAANIRRLFGIRTIRRILALFGIRQIFTSIAE